MSFQDVGRQIGSTSSFSKRPRGFSSEQNDKICSVHSARSEEASSASFGAQNNVKYSHPGSGLDALSDTITQYQKNIAIFKSISNSAMQRNPRRAMTDREEKEMVLKLDQYESQRNVVLELGMRVEDLLKKNESRLSTISSRAQAEQARNMHLKLSRDFRTVQATFRKIDLAFKEQAKFEEARARKENSQQPESDDVNRWNTSNEVEARQRQMQLRSEEDKIDLQIMHEREEELKNINRKMHTVNQIYKDLAHLVEGQQEDIDEVEHHVEVSTNNAKQGLEQLEKANTKSQQGCVVS